MTPRTARLLLALGAFVAGLVLFSAVIFIVTGRSPAPIAMSAVGGPFKLVDQNDKPITEQDMKGRAVPGVLRLHPLPGRLPDHAVRGLRDFPRARARRQESPRACSSPSIRSATRPRCIKDYLSSFDPRIIGVTGDDAAITAAEKSYRVYAKKVPTDGGGYTMDHTAIVYLMSKDGRFVAPFNMKRRPEEAAAELKRYL